MRSARTTRQGRPPLGQSELERMLAELLAAYERGDRHALVAFDRGRAVVGPPVLSVGRAARDSLEPPIP